MSDTHGRLFLQALDQRWGNYRNQLQAGRQQISEESIHDLRVAVRRLLAMLSMLRTVDAHAPIQKVRRLLKSQLDELDELRDAQVMLLETAHMLENIPQLAPIQIYEFQNYLEKREKDFIQTAQKDLSASRPSDLESRFEKLRAVAEDHVADELLLDKILQAVDAAYAKTAHALENVDANDIDTIHRVRIAFKNFRYMIETVRPFLNDYPEGLLESMHGYQDAMGSVHDITVFLDRLKEFEKSLAKRSKTEAQQFAPTKIEAYYKKRLDKFVRAYFECKDEFHAFWRPAPDQPFPWERSHDTLRRTSRNRRTTGHAKQRTARQPAASDRRGAQEDAQDRPGSEGVGSPD
jgi:CHAD domain-containing protein